MTTPTGTVSNNTADQQLDNNGADGISLSASVTVYTTNAAAKAAGLAVNDLFLITYTASASDAGNHYLVAKVKT